MLNEETNRRRHNTGLADPRGKPSKLSETNVDRMDEILQTWGLTWGLEASSFTWNQLGIAAEVPEVGLRTIQRAVNIRRYKKCIACTNTYASEPLKAKCRDLAWEKEEYTDSRRLEEGAIFG